MNEWKVTITNALPNTQKATGITHDISVLGPKGGGYLFFRRGGHTFFGTCVSSRHTKKPPQKAVELAEKII